MEVEVTVSAEPVRRFIRSYDDLDVFQRSMDLLLPIHAVTRAFPDIEKYDLGQQMRRACKSVPANIAEGYAKRRSAKEFRAYLTNAVGSANEMEVHLKIARKLEYMSCEDFGRLLAAYQIVGKQLTKLIQHWRTYDVQPAHAPGIPDPNG